MADGEVIASVRTSLDEDMSKVMAFGLVRKGALCTGPSVESSASVNCYDSWQFPSHR